MCQWTTHFVAHAWDSRTFALQNSTHPLCPRAGDGLETAAPPACMAGTAPTQDLALRPALPVHHPQPARNQARQQSVVNWRFLDPHASHAAGETVISACGTGASCHCLTMTRCQAGGLGAPGNSRTWLSERREMACEPSTSQTTALPSESPEASLRR